VSEKLAKSPIADDALFFEKAVSPFACQERKGEAVEIFSYVVLPPFLVPAVSLGHVFIWNMLPRHSSPELKNCSQSKMRQYFNSLLGIGFIC
jgi:hypothetical protein